jgi:hypothetical protein
MKPKLAGAPVVIDQPPLLTGSTLFRRCTKAPKSNSASSRLKPTRMNKSAATWPIWDRLDPAGESKTTFSPEYPASLRRLRANSMLLTPRNGSSPSLDAMGDSTGKMPTSPRQPSGSLINACKV